MHPSCLPQQGSVSSADDKHNYHVSDVDERVVDLEAAKWARRENGEDNDEADAHNRLFSRFSAMLHSPYAIYVRDFGLIALILGWWIPSIINPAVRYRWVPATILVRSFSFCPMMSASLLYGSLTASLAYRPGSSSSSSSSTTPNIFPKSPSSGSWSLSG